MGPMRIIVNADDLGMRPEVNAAVFELMSRQRISSATMMANGPAVEEAARELGNFPSCSFGAHLNLTEFRPLTNHPGLRPILADSGELRKDAIREVKITPELQEAAFEEWSAQVKRLTALGVRLSHFDSHHHVHTVPGLFWVLKRLQKRFGMRRVRITQNLYPPHSPAPRKLLWSKALWNAMLRWYYRTRTTGGFTSAERFLEISRQGRPALRSIELMSHPGGPAFEAETQMLAGPWRENLPFPATLISYNDL